jgi:hypothetical protein
MEVTTRQEARPVVGDVGDDVHVGSRLEEAFHDRSPEIELNDRVDSHCNGPTSVCRSFCTAVYLREPITFL